MPAGNIHKLIVPVDAEGLRFDKPADQVLWRKLTNVVLRNGFIETRPGLDAVGPQHQDFTNLPMPIVSLQESVQWQNIGTKFTGGTGSPTETLAPSADAGGSWTGSFLDIDEDPPNNGSTKLISTLRNDTVKIDFVNPTNTYDIIDGVYVYIRARSPSGGENILEIARADTATEANGVSTTPTADIYASLNVSNMAYRGDSDSRDTGAWMDFFIPLHVPTTGSLVSAPFWTNARLDSAAVDVTLRESSNVHSTVYKANGTDSDNTFTGVTDAWKTLVSEVPLPFFLRTNTFNTGTVGQRLSLTYDGIPSDTILGSIKSVSPSFAVAAVGTVATALIYHKGTDSVRRTVVATEQVNFQKYRPTVAEEPVFQYIGGGSQILLNPETGVAWTIAEIKAGPEFGIEVVTGTIRMSASQVTVFGSTTTAVLEIDNIKLIVIGREFTGANAGEATTKTMGRIMATGDGWQRLINENADDVLQAPFEDISSGVSRPKRNVQPLEHTFFFDRIYWQNGTEAPFYYEGKTISQLGSSTPIGQSIWTFGNRLMQCDITETVGGVTTRHIKRVAWSGIAGPDEWQAVDSGTLDLTDGGKGRARKGMALSQQMSAIYLDKGIYNLRWTGDSAAPFSPRLQDPDTGIIGPQTLQKVMDQGGSTLHMFLGDGPQGVNIYIYDGNQAQPVGNDIKDELNRVYRAGKAEFAFAELEPRLNLYMLFLPETGQDWPAQAWVFGLGTNSWVRWEFPFSITCAGKWTLAGYTDAAAKPVVDGAIGAPSMVMGTSIGVPYKWDFHVATDFLTPRQRLVADTDDFYNFDAGGGTAKEQGILWDIQTGDLIISRNDIIRQTAVKRIWITYEDRGICDIEISESVDSGDNWINVTNISLGTEGSATISRTTTRPLREVVADFDLPTASRHHRIRIRPDQTAITNGENFANARQKFKLAKIVIEYEDLGEAP